MGKGAKINILVAKVKLGDACPSNVCGGDFYKEEP